jgi:hypothetical protein
MPAETRLVDRSMTSVMVMCDRGGGALTAVLPESDLFNLRLAHVLAGKLTGRPTLVLAQGKAGPFSNPSIRRAHPAFERLDIAAGGALDLLMLRSSVTILETVRRIDRDRVGSVNDAGNRSPLIHVRTMRSYACRLVAWLGRFRGVAMRYLDNYLAWHLSIDRSRERLTFEQDALRWPLSRTRQHFLRTERQRRRKVASREPAPDPKP